MALVMIAARIRLCIGYVDTYQCGQIQEEVGVARPVHLWLASPGNGHCVGISLIMGSHVHGEIL